MNVTIDFDGEVREYELSDNMANALRQGAEVIVEVRHPTYGEHCRIYIAGDMMSSAIANEFG